MHTDYVGFLPKNESFEFKGVTITPVDGFDAALVELNEEANEDGFFYPPTMYKVKPASDEPDAPPVRIPNTTRPLAVFRMPQSHRIDISTNLHGDARQEDGAFLMHALGYLFGYRLQFHDWWFEGRIPFGKGQHHVYVTTEVVSRKL